MGTDVYPKYHKEQDDGSWEEVELDEDYDFARNYLWFSVLADVRNGTGFAGTLNHIPVVPVVPPRGRPEDMDDDDINWFHSQSWMMFSEILEYFKTTRRTTRYGVIARRAYLDWDGKSEPFAYAGMVGGPDVKIYDAREDHTKKYVPEEYSHVHITWTVLLNVVLKRYVDLIQRAYDEYGDLRLFVEFD